MPDIHVWIHSYVGNTYWIYQYRMIISDYHAERISKFYMTSKSFMNNISINPCKPEKFQWMHLYRFLQIIQLPCYLLQVTKRAIIYEKQMICFLCLCKIRHLFVINKEYYDLNFPNFLWYGSAILNMHHNPEKF